LVCESLASNSCKVWWDLTRLYCAFFLQPLMIATGLDMQTVATRCVLQLVPLRDLYKLEARSIAFSVYQKCRLPMWRGDLFASLYAPATTLASDVTNPTAAMGVLAPHFFFRNAKKTIGSSTPITDASFNVLEPDRMVHVVYAFKKGALLDWGVVCVHDAVGELLNVFVVESALDDARLLDLMTKTFDKLVNILGYGGGIRWRIVLGKLGRMKLDELQAWKLVFTRLTDSLSGLVVGDVPMDAVNSLSLVSLECESGLKMFNGGKHVELEHGDEASCSLVGVAPRTFTNGSEPWSSGWLVTMPLSKNLVSSTDVVMLQASVPVGAPVFTAQVDLWWHVTRLVDPVLTNFAPWGKPEDQASHVVSAAILRDVLRNYQASRSLDCTTSLASGSSMSVGNGARIVSLSEGLDVCGATSQGGDVGQVGLDTTGQWPEHMLPMPYQYVSRLSKVISLAHVLP